MMFSDEEIKEIPESHLMQPGDEIIGIREVCLGIKKECNVFNENYLSNTKNDFDSSRPLYGTDGYFNVSLETQARFVWTEEDGNIASMVSEPGFGTTGQTTFGKDLDGALKDQIKDSDASSTSSSKTCTSNFWSPWMETNTVSSTSSEFSTETSTENKSKSTPSACKIDKADPRSRFHYVKYIKRHGRTIKLWECSICGREFQHQYTLMRHLPTHTDERNFHCDACGKSFRQLSTLSQHRAIHSSERPYACEVCNKTFNRVSTLISHRKTHSENKPYKCHMCPKGFHQKGNLRNHLFTHTNERPYRCNICMKGFNQQSNLVCHKNKAHPDDAFDQTNPQNAVLEANDNNVKPAIIPTTIDQCEVSSTIGPFLPSIENREQPWPKLEADWALRPNNALDPWSYTSWVPNVGNGVVVDNINTYHMGVAMAKRQTPFALLKPDHSNPVLVKVVDAKLPNGKQMLVPATAEDLRVGGKIVVNNESNKDPLSDANKGMSGAVQIRVPVVAVVIPKIRPGGRLQLTVEEPHHAYHTALSTDAIGDYKADPCSSKNFIKPRCISSLTRSETMTSSVDAVALGNSSFDQDPVNGSCQLRETVKRLEASNSISSSCTLPPPTMSPPLDLMSSMELFDPMDCIPMGPQIIPVDNIDAPPHSDESDIFIGEFEESIPLSESD